MRLLPYIVPILLPFTTSSLLPLPQSIFSNPPASGPHHRIPSVRESAIMARRILRHEGLGTLSTVFPADEPTTRGQPASVAGAPLGLPEYFGDCEPATGNPTILAVSIASSIRNAAASGNVTLSMRWHPPPPARRRRGSSAAALPRFALFGALERIGDEVAEEAGVARCFAGYHPDSRIWMPGSDIHESHWVRLVVKEVYWFGGFGDRAYIGWIPVETWRNVTEEEIQKCRLPGEETSWMDWQAWFGGFDL